MKHLATRIVKSFACKNETDSFLFIRKGVHPETTMKFQDAQEEDDINRNSSPQTLKSEENASSASDDNGSKIIGMTLEIGDMAGEQDTECDFIDLEAMMQNPRRASGVKKSVHWAPIVEASSSSNCSSPSTSFDNGIFVGVNDSGCIWRRNTEIDLFDDGVFEEEEYKIIFHPSSDQQEYDDYPLQIKFTPSEDLESIYDEESPTATAPENTFEKLRENHEEDYNTKQDLNFFKFFTMLLFLSFTSGHGSQLLHRYNIPSFVFGAFQYGKSKAKTHISWRFTKETTAFILREEKFLQPQLFPVFQRGLESTHSLRSKAANFVPFDEDFLQFRLNEVGVWLR